MYVSSLGKGACMCMFVRVCVRACVCVCTLVRALVVKMCRL